MVMQKIKFYADNNNLNPIECAPSIVNGVVILPEQHADAINSIADNDPAFLVWLGIKRWADIKAFRDQQKNGGVMVDGKWFHTDADSRIQWLGLFMLGQNVPPIQWKTMDGTFVTMTPTLAGSVFQAIVAGDSADFANAEDHRLAMEASATPESYDYSTGWRQVYA